MRGNGGRRRPCVPLANSSNTPCSTGSIAANTSSCVDEAHLEVELVELARRAVGARVLVAEAGRDLEVAVEAGDHQQLLELLRRLRQRVELARDGCGSAPGSRARPPGELAVRIGVWNSVKPCSIMRRRIEAMTAERSMMFACSCSRRRSRKRYLSRISSGYSCSPETGIGSSAAADWTATSPARELDLAGRQVRVHRLRRARDDLAGDRDHRFDAQRDRAS